MNQKATERTTLAAVVEGHIATHGLTLRDVSARTGIPLTTLHRRLHSPDIDSGFRVQELDSLARLFGTTPAELLSQQSETSAA